MFSICISALVSPPNPNRQQMTEDRREKDTNMCGMAQYNIMSVSRYHTGRENSQLTVRAARDQQRMTQMLKDELNRAINPLGLQSGSAV